jgi:hypothetical protein
VTTDGATVAATPLMTVALATSLIMTFVPTAPCSLTVLERRSEIAANEPRTHDAADERGDRSDPPPMLALTVRLDFSWGNRRYLGLRS